MTPEPPPRVLGDHHDRLPLLVPRVRDEGEGEGLAVLFQEPGGVPAPARLPEEARGAVRVVGEGLHLRIVVGHLPREGAGGPLALAVEDVADDLVDVDREPERGPHPHVLEDRAPHVVADVRVPEGEGRGGVEPRVVPEPGGLVGLGAVAVRRPGVEGELRGQEVRDDPDQVLAEVRRALPVVVVADQPDELVGLPLGEAVGAGAHRAAVEARVPHAELGRVLAGGPRLGGEPLAVQEVLREDAHGPALEARLEEALVRDANRVAIGRVHPLHRLVVRDPGREVLRVHDRLVRELDVARRELLAVVEPHPPAEGEDDDRVGLGRLHVLLGGEAGERGIGRLDVAERIERVPGTPPGAGRASRRSPGRPRSA